LGLLVTTLITISSSRQSCSPEDYSPVRSKSAEEPAAVIMQEKEFAAL
jgi:hypothetical protein